MKNDYLYILDFCQVKLFEIENVPEDINIEEFLNQYGLSEDQCSYMFSENKLEIEDIKPIKKL